MIICFFRLSSGFSGNLSGKSYKGTVKWERTVIRQRELSRNRKWYSYKEAKRKRKYDAEKIKRYCSNWKIRQTEIYDKLKNKTNWNIWLTEIEDKQTNKTNWKIRLTEIEDKQKNKTKQFRQDKSIDKTEHRQDKI